jgi:hypothetical protein
MAEPYRDARPIMTATQLPSERSFGALFAAVSAVLAGYGFLKHWAGLYIVLAMGGAVALALLTLFIPKVLSPFNRAWHQLGLMLGKIVSPIVLGILFYGLLTPVAMISRRFGRDELKLKPQALASYWIARVPPGPESDSFKNQF